MTYRYCFEGDTPQVFPSLALEVEPGQEFESPEEIIHPHVVAVKASTEQKSEE